MLWWGQPTHALHKPQAHTTADDQEAEQLNQSHKANGGQEREASGEGKEFPAQTLRPAHQTYKD